MKGGRPMGLVADVGGTHSRCALVSHGSPHHLEVVDNSRYRGLGDVLEDYLQRTGAARPAEAAIGVAAPVTGDQVRLVNLDWEFSIHRLQQRLALRRLHVINDLSAVALSLPLLGAGDRLQVGGGDPQPERTMVVLGPGTGLGVSGLVPGPGGWAVVEGEGGHASLPALDEREARLVAALRRRHGHCSRERVLSGPGIEAVYGVLAGGDGQDLPDAEKVAGQAAAGSDPVAVQTMALFFAMLGGVAGDLALTFGALGGVYLAGGILPANRALLLGSQFRRRFEDKGRFRGYLGAIPSYLITAADPALIGLRSLLGR